MASASGYIAQSSRRWARLAVVTAVVAGCSAGGEPTPLTTGAAGSGGTGGSGGPAMVLDGSSNTENTNCAAETYGATRVPASVLLLLDRSASMSQCAGGGECAENKWVGAKNAIQAALASAPPELRVGLSIFPAVIYDGYSKCQSCLTNSMLKDAVPAGCEPVLADCGCNDVAASADVPVEALSTSLSLIQAKLAANEPDYNTPTFHALRAAYQIMTDLPTDGDRYVLLMTDGDPTVLSPKHKVVVPPANTYNEPEMYNECLQLEDILAQTQVATAASPSVRTFVVGSPGVENTKFLSELAQAGATPKAAGCETTDTCHYQIGESDFAKDLQAVLTEIAGQVATCTFAVPLESDKVDPNRVNVSYQIGAEESQQLYMDPARQDGWDYTDDSHTKVEIFGPACDSIKKNTQSSVTIALGCMTLVK